MVRCNDILEDNQPVKRKRASHHDDDRRHGPLPLTSRSLPRKVRWKEVGPSAQLNPGDVVADSQDSTSSPRH